MSAAENTTGRNVLSSNYAHDVDPDQVMARDAVLNAVKDFVTSLQNRDGETYQALMLVAARWTQFENLKATRNA
jgi:hypothetical protein